MKPNRKEKGLKKRQRLKGKDKRQSTIIIMLSRNASELKKKLLNRKG